MKQELAQVRVIASTKNWIEGAAVQQLEKTAALPGMRLAVGLPDLHPGKGSPIGAAYAVEGWLYPTLVGNDIGCGIGLWRTELSARRIKREDWADRMKNLDHAWDGNIQEFLACCGVEPTGYEHSLGTIGSGNHFAELQTVEDCSNPDACRQLGVTNDAVYLCVHSGSRGFGEAILREHTDVLAAGGLQIGSAEASRYLNRHQHAREWAVANRALIAERVAATLKTKATRILDICHNYVEPIRLGENECWLHRKGAAPSTEGAVLIPGSRGAFTYVMRPTGPTERSAFSLAHGAGRKWARSDCRGRLEKRYTSKDLLRTELGSLVICEDKDLLYEEAPQAYKNISVVIEDLIQDGLAEVIGILRPLITYKVRR
jgi:release factor H-coupled RctB family protein